MNSSLLPEEAGKGKPEVGGDGKLAQAGFPQGVFQTNLTCISAMVSSWGPTR